MFRIQIRIDFGRLEGKNDPTKIGKRQEIASFQGLYAPICGAEGFSCSLDVLYAGLGQIVIIYLKKN